MASGKSINESSVRSRAKRVGYVVHKSRQRPHFENQGEFMLVDANRNAVVLGSRYDATLEEIADFIDGGSNESSKLTTAMTVI